MSNAVRTEKTNNLKIFENVVCKIVEIAALDVDGVCGFVTSGTDFTDLFIRAVRQPDIGVRVSDGSAEISLGIKISGKCRVKSVAEKVQKRVKDDVQSMTGIAVTKVNVYIYGIVFDTESSENDQY
ncbi:MAG: Asp23/Gls24 family envelope stress response protein [Oscillospiraceae bacterium]|nr:Asp23/Gls24 family envelope stress response protein [Oscillospiraceae bacterium]